MKIEKIDRTKEYANVGFMLKDVINKQEEIIDWINNYEGAKEDFRQRLLSGNIAGLKMDEKQMEIVRNAKQTEDGELTTTDSLRPETLADPNE